MTKRDWCYFLAGFVAGEGCFYAHPTRNWWQLAVQVHVRDRVVLEKLQALLGVGTVKVFPSRPTMVRFEVGSVGACLDHVVPFMDKYLACSHKREQYRAWRRKLVAYKRAREWALHKPSP